MRCLELKQFASHKEIRGESIEDTCWHCQTFEMYNCVFPFPSNEPYSYLRVKLIFSKEWLYHRSSKSLQ